MYILATEFASFTTQAAALYENLDGEAELSTIENQLKIILHSDGLGHFCVTGHIMDEAGVGNTLRYELNIDQTQLQSTIKELNMLLEKYPERKV